MAETIAALRESAIDPILQANLATHFGNLSVGNLGRKVEGFFVGASRDIQALKSRLITS